VYVVCHTRAEAVVRNEMPLGRDTRMVPSNIILDIGPGGSLREGNIWSRVPQFAAMPPNAKLLWPLFFLFRRIIPGVLNIRFLNL